MKTLLAVAMTFSMIGPVAGKSLENAMSAYREGDVTEALRDWHKLADEGSADAMFNLGQVYRFGYGVDSDMDEAALYLTQAASMGHLPAQRELANLYFFDIGTPDLKRTAINLWQTAARNGDGRAQYTLGVLFFTGDMVPRNQALGFAWTLLATEAGIPEATQLQTAMQAQLSDQDLQKGWELSSTLMTGGGAQPDYALLVGELPQIPRRPAPVPVQTAVAVPQELPAETIVEPAVEETGDVDEEPEATVMAETQPALEPEIEPEQEPEPEAKSEVSLVAEVVQDELAADPPVEDTPAEEAATVIAEAVPEQRTVEMPEAMVDEFDETRQVLAGLLDETSQEEETPATPEPQAIQMAVVSDPVDLGDPASPLVSANGFGDDWSLQLTSFRRPENAEAHWQEVMQDYPALFTGLEKRILRFDLGPDKGVYYRLRVGPFASREMADQKCNELTDNALGCLVIWP